MERKVEGKQVFMWYWVGWGVSESGLGAWMLGCSSGAAANWLVLDTGAIALARYAPPWQVIDVI
jgi:hypothetical protein